MLGVRPGTNAVHPLAPCHFYYSSHPTLINTHHGFRRKITIETGSSYLCARCSPAPSLARTARTISVLPLAMLPKKSPNSGTRAPVA